MIMGPAAFQINSAANVTIRRTVRITESGQFYPGEYGLNVGDILTVTIVGGGGGGSAGSGIGYSNYILVTFLLNLCTQEVVYMILNNTIIQQASSPTVPDRIIRTGHLDTYSIAQYATTVTLNFDSPNAVPDGYICTGYVFYTGTDIYSNPLTNISSSYNTKYVVYDTISCGLFCIGSTEYWYGYASVIRTKQHITYELYSHDNTTPTLYWNTYSNIIRLTMPSNWVIWFPNGNDTSVMKSLGIDMYFSEY